MIAIQKELQKSETINTEVIYILCKQSIQQIIKIALQMFQARVLEVLDSLMVCDLGNICTNAER
jgi:hypothetical protein